MTALRSIPSALTASQQSAYSGIIAAIRSRCAGAVLAAPAGSGKTYLTGVLITALLRTGHKVAGTATSNKAVAVLAEKLPRGADAMTVHSLLGLRLKKLESGGYKLEREGKSQVDKFNIIVVDECSMLNQELFDMLMAERQGFLLFVGDPAQLPPPISGLEKSPVFDDPRLQHFQLTEIVRQAAGSPILTLATAIRHHEGGGFPVVGLHEYANGKGVQIIPRSDLLDHWHEGARILAWRNETVQAYNRDLHQRLHPGAQEPFCPGERVLLHTQHETRQGFRLHTSAEGVIIDIERGDNPRWPQIPAWQVQVRMDNGTVANEFYPVNPQQLINLIADAWKQWREAKLAKDELGRKRWSSIGWSLKDSFIPLRLAYASTTHKAQGSTYHTAILDVPDLRGIKAHRDFNKLLYTAVTRPSDQLILAMEPQP